MPMLSGQIASYSVPHLNKMVLLSRRVLWCYQLFERVEDANMSAEACSISRLLLSLYVSTSVADFSTSPTCAFCQPQGACTVTAQALNEHVSSRRSPASDSVASAYAASHRASQLSWTLKAAILLEQCSSSLRDAEACIGHSIDRQTGVYVGVMHMEYIQYMTGERPGLPLYGILVSCFLSLHLLLEGAVGHSHHLCRRMHVSCPCSSTEVWHPQHHKSSPSRRV